jgi:hypothetical protein
MNMISLKSTFPVNDVNAVQWSSSPLGPLRSRIIPQSLEQGFLLVRIPAFGEKLS